MPLRSPDWKPAAGDIQGARITEFAEFVSDRIGRDLTAGYHDLWAWSVSDINAFWDCVWDFFRLPARPAGARALDRDVMPGASWFPGTKLSYVSAIFEGRNESAVALIVVNETANALEITWGELRHRVAALAATLGRLGVAPGDRVVGYLPNAAEAVVAFLATACLGAIWAVCGMDYGVAAAVARFGQLKPMILIAAVEYTYAGKTIDRREEIRVLRAALPSLRATIVVGDGDSEKNAVPWATATADEDAPFAPLMVPFDHPLWVLFTSGTTGPPKGIVHGHGGVLLEHLKHSALHANLGPGDRVFWYTTLSWMMWNFLVGNLLVGVTIVCYEGSPGHPEVDTLWRLAARLRVTMLGTSPAYLAACRKTGIELADHDLRSLIRLGVTGSTFSPELQRWVAGELGPGVQIALTSGGTDVVTSFAGAAPTVPVWAGQLSAPSLGVALDSVDDEGRSVRGEAGELVVRRPMPSMPLYFWGDRGYHLYREAYFDHFPGLWRHGDQITITDHGSVIIHGRSDATLNRRGVRMGSGDIYGLVERLPEIAEALVIGLEEPDGGYWMPLFVTTVEGYELDDKLRTTILDTIRQQLSPRHVPDEIIAAPGVPHTRTGKKLEVPVKRILGGEGSGAVLDHGSVDRPELLVWYAGLGALHRARESG